MPPKILKWERFESMKEVNDFIQQTIEEGTSGMINYINGRPDHVVNIQYDKGELILFYWSKA